MPNTTPDPQPPTPRPKGTRGGRRPGAGAPKGNLNALKHSRFSNDTIVAGMVMTVFPEVLRFFESYIKSQDQERRMRYRDILLAGRILQGELPETIKLQSIQRLEKAMGQLRKSIVAGGKNGKTITQSNPRQDDDYHFVPFMQELEDRINHTGLYAPDAFPDFPDLP